MITTSHVPIDNRDMLARVPAWITSTRAETLEDVAFLSGAALNHLHLVLGRANVPHALLRDRMALRAAEACVAFSGRQERAGELRDAVHLLRSGDLPGRRAKPIWLGGARWSDRFRSRRCTGLYPGSAQT